MLFTFLFPHIKMVYSVLEKVYFKSQILVHEYWTKLDHFGIPVLFAFGYHQHVLKNVNITFSGNTGTPEISQYSPILGCSSIQDRKYTFSSVFIFTITHAQNMKPYLPIVIDATYNSFQSLCLDVLQLKSNRKVRSNIQPG